MRHANPTGIVVIVVFLVVVLAVGAGMVWLIVWSLKRSGDQTASAKQRITQTGGRMLGTFNAKHGVELMAMPSEIWVHATGVYVWPTMNATNFRILQPMGPVRAASLMPTAAPLHAQSLAHQHDHIAIQYSGGGLGSTFVIEAPPDVQQIIAQTLSG